MTTTQLKVRALFEQLIEHETGLTIEVSSSVTIKVPPELIKAKNDPENFTIARVRYLLSRL
jgi:hypothetical protein